MTASASSQSRDAGCRSADLAPPSGTESRDMPGMDVGHLLYELCTRLGYCLPPDAQARLIADPPPDVAASPTQCSAPKASTRRLSIGAPGLPCGRWWHDTSPTPSHNCRSALRRSISGDRPGSGRSQRAIGATSSVWSVTMTVPHRETPEEHAPAHHHQHHHHDDEHHDRTAHHALARPSPGSCQREAQNLPNLGPLRSVPRIGMAADISITACTAPERPRRAGGSRSSRTRARCHRSLPVPRLRRG